MLSQSVAAPMAKWVYVEEEEKDCAVQFLLGLAVRYCCRRYKYLWNVLSQSALPMQFHTWFFSVNSQHPLRFLSVLRFPDSFIDLNYFIRILCSEIPRINCYFP